MTTFDTSTLPADSTARDDLESEADPEDTQLPDVYVGLEIDLLAPGDGVVTDRHHASADRYEADDPMNQIEGQISPFTLSGWLRHGCEAVLQELATTACHPGEPNADYMLQDVCGRDLDAESHERGSSVETDDDLSCVVYDLFGGFGDRAGRVIRRTQRAIATTIGVARRRDGTASAWTRPLLLGTGPTGIDTEYTTSRNS